MRLTKEAEMKPIATVLIIALLISILLTVRKSSYTQERILKTVIAIEIQHRRRAEDDKRAEEISRLVDSLTAPLPSPYPPPKE